MAITNPLLKTALENLVDVNGKFDKDIQEGGAYYRYPDANLYQPNGITCKNCAFYNAEEHTCTIVDGYIYDYGMCRFWNIPDSKITAVVIAPTEYIAMPQQTTGVNIMETMMPMMMMFMMMAMVMPMMSGIA
jgi:hypothetical protein